jgi:hypothetical protein
LGLTELDQVDGSLVLTAIGIEIALLDLYARVGLTAQASDASAHRTGAAQTERACATLRKRCRAARQSGKIAVAAPSRLCDRRDRLGFG